MFPLRPVVGPPARLARCITVGSCSSSKCSVGQKGDRWLFVWRACQGKNKAYPAPPPSTAPPPHVLDRARRYHINSIGMPTALAPLSPAIRTSNTIPVARYVPVGHAVSEATLLIRSNSRRRNGYGSDSACLVNKKPWADLSLR